MIIFDKSTLLLQILSEAILDCHLDLVLFYSKALILFGTIPFYMVPFFNKLQRCLLSTDCSSSSVFITSLPAGESSDNRQSLS